MNSKKHYRKIKIYILVIMLTYTFFISSDCVPVNSMSMSEIIDHDLNISQEIDINERITTVTLTSEVISFPESPHALFMILNMQNIGDELKRLNVKVQYLDNEWQQVFTSLENLLDVKYDFQQITDLVIPLSDYSPSHSQDFFKINITLEYYLSVNEVNAIFDINNVKIHQILQLKDIEVLIIPSSFNVRLSSTRVNLIQRILTNSYLVSNISASSELVIVAELETNFVIEDSELEDTSMNSNRDKITNQSQLSFIVDKNITKLGIRVTPESGINQDCSINIKLLYIEKQTKNAAQVFQPLDIPNHPIPAVLMFVFLNLFLFGVPTYYIFNEDSISVKKIRKMIGR